MPEEPTPKERNEIRALGASLASYHFALESGATHAECLEILVAGGMLGSYGWVRKRGATHAECLEILVAGGTLRGYDWALDSGATHAECLALAPATRLDRPVFGAAVAALRLLDPLKQTTPVVCELLCGLADRTY